MLTTLPVMLSRKSAVQAPLSARWVQSARLHSPSGVSVPLQQEADPGRGLPSMVAL